MQIRDYSLPMGWYPREKGEVSAFLSDFDNKNRSSRAAIMPHAGWYYSGRTAALAASSLKDAKPWSFLAVILVRAVRPSSPWKTR